MRRDEGGVGGNNVGVGSVVQQRSETTQIAEFRMAMMSTYGYNGTIFTTSPRQMCTDSRSNNRSPLPN